MLNSSLFFSRINRVLCWWNRVFNPVFTVPSGPSSAHPGRDAAVRIRDGRYMDMAEEKRIIVALDAMGGDYAPSEHVKGAVEASEQDKDIVILLFGDRTLLEAELAKYSYDKERIRIEHCESVVENCDVPTVAIRQKRDSSMVKGLYALRNDEADAFVSCGNTGALLVGGQTIVGRIRGVVRCGLAFLVPSMKEPVLLIDAGANVDTRPEMLVQFAKMGSIYMNSVIGVKEPRVGLVNIGEEESKGNQLVRETFPLLTECGEINFIGSLESRGLTEGLADVAVCDGFVGNTILKTYEGVAASMLKVIKDALTATTVSKIGAALSKKNLKKALQQFSVEEYGGAPMLGLKKFVVKTHGNSKAAEIRNTILQCKTAVAQGIDRKIADAISEGK